jgi:hypothetical protein
MWISLLPHTFHMSRPSHLHWTDQYICWEAKIMKLRIMRFSFVPPYFIPLGPTCESRSYFHLRRRQRYAASGCKYGAGRAERYYCSAFQKRNVNSCLWSNISPFDLRVDVYGPSWWTLKVTLKDSSFLWRNVLSLL